jgi:hypothetical protein
MEKVLENDLQRVMRLCSESCELLRSKVEEIPANLSRDQLRYDRLFDHNTLGSITNIAGFAKFVIKRPVEGENYWPKIFALAKRLYLNLERNFVALAEERAGFEIIGAFMLIKQSSSDELQIEADRVENVRIFGEGSPELEEYDENLRLLNDQEEAAIKLMPECLQALFRIRKNLDEIAQLAERNIDQLEKFDGRGLA